MNYFDTTFASVRPSDSRTMIEDRIRSFGGLEAGWHYGAGVPVTQKAVSIGLQLSNLLSGYEIRAIEAFPDTEGGLIVSVHYGRDLIDISSDANGNLDILREVDGEEIESLEQVNLYSVYQYVQGLKWRRKNFSASFIPSISVSSKENLRTQLSKTPRMEQVFQSLNVAVPLLSTAANALTLKNITPEASQETLLYTGQLIRA